MSFELIKYRHLPHKLTCMFYHGCDLQVQYPCDKLNNPMGLRKTVVHAILSFQKSLLICHH